jgi:hypothetical protein
LVVLAGCADADWNRLEAKRNQIQIACYEKRNAGKINSWADAVRCATPDIERLYAAAGWPHMDLLKYERAQYLSIADQMDRGMMTHAQADAAFAEVNMKVNSEMSRRAAAEQANRAAMFSAFQAVNSAPTPQPMTCTTTGSFTRCY